MAPNIMKFKFYSLLFLLAPIFCSCTELEKQPNIVFFLVDDLGWMDVGCYGSSFYETPNIDRLAEEGVRFTSAYVACHVCSPTRASIITGKCQAVFILCNVYLNSQWFKLLLPFVGVRFSHFYT